jgi:hypothetical protein
VEGGRDDAEELVRFVRGLKVDAASLRGLEASLFTREGVSMPGTGCDMMGYFRCMICYECRSVYGRCSPIDDYGAMRSCLGILE